MLEHKFAREVGRKHCEWYGEGAYSDDEFARIMSSFPYTETEVEDLVEPYGSFEDVMGWGVDNGYVSHELYDRVGDILELRELRKDLRSSHYIPQTALNKAERVDRLRMFKEFTETAKTFRWRVK